MAQESYCKLCQGLAHPLGMVILPFPTEISSSEIELNVIFASPALERPVKTPPPEKYVPENMH